MRYPYYQDMQRIKKPSQAIPQRGRPFFVIFCTIIIGLLIILQKKNPDLFQTTNASNESPETTAVPVHLSENKSKNTVNTRQELLDKIATRMEKEVGTYSIYVYDLETDASFGINEHTLFDAASLTKIQILSSLYTLVKQKEIDLNQTITLQEKDIQDYGTGTIRYENPGKVYSLKTLAQLMMKKSDNTAAYILATQIIGYPRLKKHVMSWGLEQTDIDKNESSNFDMAITLKKLYRYEILDKTRVQEMFDFMINTDFEDRIPAKLPPQTIVYHKTGDQVSTIHDVGIVKIDNHPYYIGILTTNIFTKEASVKEAMADVSKMIYEYQNSL